MTKAHVFITLVFAFSSSLRAEELNLQHLHEVTQKNLRFISQMQEPHGDGIYQAGEWPVFMSSYLLPSIVGLGKAFSQPTPDPNAFVTSSMINLLIEAHLANPKYTEVPTLVDKALPSLARYRRGDVFHYYPLREFKGHQLHAPMHPDYVPDRMMRLALMPPDADTTSVTHAALANVELLRNQTPVDQYRVPEGALKSYREFRDVKRDPHPYNRMFGMKNTGAYLTWLWDDKAETSSFMKSIVRKHHHGYRVTFGRNDVDCVVNANVIRLLAMTKNTNQSGYAESCEFLNEIIRKDKAKYCAPYYPNTYIPLYTMSGAYQAGASCLEKSRAQVIEKIKMNQQADGSWSNDEGIGRIDRVHTTALALNALMNYIQDPEEIRVHNLKEIVKRGVQFLLTQKKNRGPDQIYWTGEVFFSGSAPARNTLLWRSDTYTTALVFSSFVKAEKLLQTEVSQ